MRLRFVSGLVLALGLLAGSVSVTRASDSPNNAFRFGAGWVTPDGKATVNSGTVDVNTEDELGYFIDYERRLIPWLGIDFEVLYAQPVFDFTPSGGGQTTEQPITTWTGNLGLNFHVFARSRVDLYLGVFGSYTDFDQAFDSSYGYGGIVGLDIGLTKNGLILVTSVRYTETDADVSGSSGSIPYNPLVYQLGLGWRF